MLRLFTIAVVVLTPLISIAADLKIGDLVFLKPDAEATNDGTKVDVKGILTPASVAAINGETVLLDKSWVRKCDVMTADEALEFSNAAIQLDPENARAYFIRGSILSTRAATGFSVMASLFNPMKYFADLEHAVGDLNEAIRLDRTNAQFYGTRGMVLLQSGKPDEAIEDLTEAIRICPLNAPAYLPSAYLLRASIWESKNEYGKALDDSTESIKVDPKFVPALGNVARLRSMSPDDQVRDGQQGLEYATLAHELIGPEYEADRWYYLDILAAAYAETGDFKNAVQWENKALDLLKNQDRFAGTRAMMGMLCDDHLQLYRSHKPCRLPLEFPGHAIPEMQADDEQNLAKAQEDPGDEELKKLNEVIWLEPTNAKAYFQRGENWACRAGVFSYVLGTTVFNASMQVYAEKAFNDLNDAIRLDPTMAEAYGARGKILFLTGKLDLAIQDLNEAIRLEPNDNDVKASDVNPGIVQAVGMPTATLRASVFCCRGDCWLEKGEFEKALNDWYEGIRLDPVNRKIFYQKIAWLRATCPDERFRNGKEAVQYAKKASQPDGLWEAFLHSAVNLFQPGWGDFELYGTLAAAYAETGDFAKAVKWQEKALQNAGQYWDDKTQGYYAPPGYQERLELYRSNKPFRYVRTK